MFIKREESEKVIKRLDEIGVCWRCSLRYVGEASPSVYKRKGLNEPEGTEEETSTDEQPAKKHKTNHCNVCLGLLQHLCSDDVVLQMKNKVTDGGWVSVEGISCRLSIPACLKIRHFALWFFLLQEFPELYKKNCMDQVTSMKKVWKWVVAGRTAKLLNCKVKENGAVEINIHVEYKKDQEECQLVQKLVTRSESRRKRSQPILTRCVVEARLDKADPEKLKTMIEVPPSVPDVGVAVEKIVCTFEPIYIAGRYQKFSRQLPQTPWLVDGERRLETSVQELICTSIKDALKADDIVFASSGREDVDVRMVGRGRPFYCECHNPRRTRIRREEMAALQSDINMATKLIAVQDLQVVPKSETTRLKVGEQEKTKSYKALCMASRDLTTEDYEAMKRTNIELKQKTPVRVLHRRPIAERPRAVHSMTAQPVGSNPRVFTLDVTTQAGTYIKEFVHGDFGRTTPSLQDFVGCPVDIIALDVTGVNLDWPKELDVGKS